MSADMRDSHDVESGLVDPRPVQYRDYRKLAIGSIICGLSCLGMMSLVYSVKTRAMNKGKLHVEGDRRQKAKEYSNKARNYGLAAILAWVLLLISIPLLAGLLSYLLTLIN